MVIFFIRFEHKFLRNIYSFEQIKETDDLAILLQNISEIYCGLHWFIINI